MAAYRVHCECPTPLGENPLDVTADSESDAVTEFLERNGLQGTDHQVHVSEIQEKPSTPKKSKTSNKSAADEG